MNGVTTDRRRPEVDHFSSTDIERELALCQRAIVAVDALSAADSPRVDGENAEHLRVLAEVADGLPPIVVHRRSMRVIDGVHRLRVAAHAGAATIEVLLYDGTDADAFVLAVRLNSAHGLPLSQADRATAAKRIIASHPAWSDRAIATITGHSAKTVGALRKQTEGGGVVRARVGRDGRVRPLNAADARRHVGKLLEERPDASLRELSRIAGVSVGTVRDVRRRVADGADPVPPRPRRAELKAHDVPEQASENRLRMVSSTATPDLGQLRRDPSLRFNELGRTILRLLDIGAMNEEQWQRLVDTVPVHCGDAVTAAARQCANAWERFAQQLEERDRYGEAL
jgi:ParB-like chromosome segregation protein Spo0J